MQPGLARHSGLVRVAVKADVKQEVVAYTYFVKLLRHPRLRPGLHQIPDASHHREFVDFFSWRFELEMHECGIGPVLPDGLRTPTLHHVKRTDADHIALWWECVVARTGPWQLADYRRAARLRDRLAARRRQGADINRLLPEVSRDSAPGVALRRFAESRVMRGVVPSWQEGKIWRYQLVAGALCDAKDPALPADLPLLAARLPHILDKLDALPQAYAHGDASPQNLLLASGDPDEIVAIDGGFGSPLAVGFDLASCWSDLRTPARWIPRSFAGSTRRSSQPILISLAPKATTSNPIWCALGMSVRWSCGLL